MVKKTVGGDGSFAFTSQALGALQPDDGRRRGTASFTDLVPGTYGVAETVPAGWDLTSATCSDGSNPASVNLAPGENVTCIFANTKRGSLTVVKNASGRRRQPSPSPARRWAASA